MLDKPAKVCAPELLT